MTQQNDALRLADELIQHATTELEKQVANYLRGLVHEVTALRADHARLREKYVALRKDRQEIHEIAAKQALAGLEQHNAVKKLFHAKGRYHTQLAICDLFELHGLPCERPKK